jgi:hypothetical protein
LALLLAGQLAIACSSPEPEAQPPPPPSVTVFEGARLSKLVTLHFRHRVLQSFCAPLYTQCRHHDFAQLRDIFRHSNVYAGTRPDVNFLRLISYKGEYEHGGSGWEGDGILPASISRRTH